MHVRWKIRPGGRGGRGRGEGALVKNGRGRLLPVLLYLATDRSMRVSGPRSSEISPLLVEGRNLSAEEWEDGMGKGWEVS